MNSRSKFTYEMDFDASGMEAKIDRLAQRLQQSIQNIKIPIDTNVQESQAIVAQARAQQSQITAAAKAESNERSALAKAEQTTKEQAAKAASAQVIEAEKRLTAQTKAEIREREMAQRQAASQASRSASAGSNRELIPGFGQISQIAGYTIGGLAVGAAITQGGRAAVELSQQAASYRRVGVAAESLAGSQARLNTLMAAYGQVTGGVVDKATALQNVTSLMAIGFADNAEELTEFIRAARGISLATGQQQDYVIGQLQLAIANQSTMRLDQLGLGVDEVKTRIEDLREANSGLTQEAAYQQAVLGLATEKFGALTESIESQATGVERLIAAWKNYRLELAQEFSGPIDAGADWLTRQMFPQLPEHRQGIQRNIDDAQNFGMGGLPHIQQLKELASFIDMVNGAVKNGVPVSESFMKSLAGIAEQASIAGTMSGESAEQFKRLESVFNMGAGAAYNTFGAMEDLAAAGERAGESADNTSAKMAKLASETRTTAGELGYLVDIAYSAGAGLNDLGDKADDLAGRLANVRTQFSGLNQLEQSLGRGIVNAGQRVSEVVGPVDARAMIDQAMSQLEIERESWRRQGITDPIEIALLETQLTNQLITPMTDIVDEHAEAQREADRLSKQAQREWESAAKKAEREFEQAAKKMADGFERKLGQVAGLFSPSDVTAGQAEAAKLGLYVNQPDEILRRARAVAEGGKDEWGLDWADLASRVGMNDPGGDEKARKAVAAALQKGWETGALFSDQRNLDLIDWGAVTSQVDEMRRGELGRQNLIDRAGLDPAIVMAAGYQGVLPGRMMTPMAMAQMQGGMAQAQAWNPMIQGKEGGQAYFTDVSGSMATGLMDGAMPILEKFGVDAIQIITSAMTGEQAQSQWNALGDGIGLAMVAAVESAIGRTDFVGVVTAEVIAQITDRLEQ